MRSWLGVCLGALLVSIPAPARAQPSQPVLFAATEGRVLAGAITADDGTTYLTFRGGGPDDLGTVTRRDRDGQVTVLHAFNGYDGARPEAPLRIGADGALYGTTSLGGMLRNGTAFRITTDGELTTLHDFSADEGGAPRGPLLLEADGGILGVTAGVTQHNCDCDSWRCSAEGVTQGRIFLLTAEGGFRVLHAGIRAPGGGLMRASSGALFGVSRAQSLDAAGFVGDVYRLSPEGELSVSRLVTLSGLDPRGELVEASDGYLYGANGLRVTLDLQADTRLIARAHSEHTPAFGVDGNLYYAGNGQYRRLTRPGGVDTLLQTFDSNLGTITSGLSPDGSGHFHVGFGPYLLQLTAAGSSSVLHKFAYSAGSDLESLLLTSQGELFGTTTVGGAHDYGALFAVNAASELTGLYSFANRNAGNTARLLSPLVEAPSGGVYAVTREDTPRLVRVDQRSRLETVYTFVTGTRNTTGWWEQEALFVGRDGALYGTIGVVGSPEPTWDSVLYRFDPASQALQVLATVRNLRTLMQATNGNFYGLRVDAQVELFRIDAAGTLTTLHTFQSDFSSPNPASNLAEGPDGALYGYAAGSYSVPRAVYRWTADSQFETYYTFQLDYNQSSRDNHVLVGPAGEVFVSSKLVQWDDPPRTTLNVVIMPDRTGRTLPKSVTPNVSGPDGTIYRTKPVARGTYNGFQLEPYAL